MIELGILIGLLILGYIAGSWAERNHYRSIEAREAVLIGLPCVTFKGDPHPERPVEYSELVLGSVVISVDYFKRFLAMLRNIIGGRVSSYESLVDRGRREALLRMKQMAPDADLILNTRVETSAISKTSRRKNKAVGCIEVVAYGTAVKYAVR